MHDALSETIILLAVSVLVVALFRRLKLPPVLAYLSVGILVGPHALALVANSEAIRFLAELGVAFLLFSLGLEFSLTKLISNRKAVLGLGGAQVTTSVISAGLIAWLMGTSVETAFVIGCVIALSSTAIVIKQLAEQLELDSRHGHLSVAILLFQDVAVVPMLIIIPAIAGNGSQSFLIELAYSFAQGIGVTVIMLAIGHWLLRPLFHEIAQAHSAELFTLAVLLTALVSAWTTHMAGLSMALGAFLAGMMLSETEYRHQIETDIRPFRDVLLGLFFVTIGMLLDMNSLPGMLHWVLLISAGILAGKTLIIAAMSKLVLNASTGVSLRTGLVLAQGGEFGFALLALALGSNVISHEISQLLLAAVICSMIFTPFLIRFNGWLAKSMTRSYTRERESQEQDIAQTTARLNQHVIICGFGRIGQNIANVIQQEGFPYFALDYNVDLISNAKKAGYQVMFGDSTHAAILQAAGIERAAVLVICHDNIGSAEKTLTQAKTLNPELPVLVRTQDDTYYEQLQAAGATEIIPETLESSLMMASHLLSLLGMPMQRIVRRVQEMRNNKYSTLREFFHGDEPEDIEKPDEFRKRLTCITLTQDAHAIGKTLEDLDIEKTGVSIHANRRNDTSSSIPAPNMLLKEGDVLVLFGTPENLEHAEALLLNG